MRRVLLLFSFFFSSFVYADQVAISNFSGLNSNDSSAIIADNEAQDLLNVDLTPNGKSVKKRSGYGLYKALGTGQAIHGGHHFYNTGGSDVQLWGSSTSLYGITSDASPVQIISSATVGTTWDCTDTQGYAYCVTSSRNLLLKTDGVAITQWMTSPLGTMIAVTPDRLVVAGVSGATNSLYFSQANTFNNFTTGINATDPFIEVIAAPGAAITHIAWGCQKLLWWKNSSFGYITGSNQFDLGVVTVNDTIGTSDNSSSVDPGGTVWFRGQDGHIYSYNCSALVKESIDITPLAQASANRTANSWTQSSQSEFQAGISTNPVTGLSFTISPANVTLSSYTKTDSSPTAWNAGTLTNMVVSVDSFKLTTNNANMTNNSFDSALGGEWPLNSGFVRVVNAAAGACGTVVPSDGSNFVYSDNGTVGVNTLKAELYSSTGTLLDSQTLAANAGCSWRSQTIGSSGNLGRRVYVKFTNGTSTLQSENFLLGGDIAVAYYGTAGAGSSQFLALDGIVGGSDTIKTGSFTSAAYDTALTSATYQITALGYTINTSTPSLYVQTSANGSSGWTTIITSSGTNAVGNRYVRYISSTSLTPSESANTTFDSITIVARSSGSYWSNVKNASTLSAWDTFTVNKQDNGGTHTFYIRSSTNSFLVGSTTPTWVSQAIGSLVSASTGTYFQVRDDFALTAATQTPTLNDFTVNWFEGVAADKAYSIYFDNSIWWSVAYGAGISSNNRIFKFDLINKAWLLYDIGTGGMLQQGQYLYFGSTTAASTFKFGSGTSDNGVAIQSYWKSKDFSGQDPWLENQYNQVDSIYKQNANQTLTVSYALNTSTSTTSYSINLSSSTQGIIRNKKLLPNGKIGGNVNVKFGDTSDSSQWELLGLRVQYVVQPYRPTQ